MYLRRAAYVVALAAAAATTACGVPKDAPYVPVTTTSAATSSDTDEATAGTQYVYPWDGYPTPTLVLPAAGGPWVDDTTGLGPQAGGATTVGVVTGPGGDYTVQVQRGTHPLVVPPGVTPVSVVLPGGYVGQTAAWDNNGKGVRVTQFATTDAGVQYTVHLRTVAAADRAAEVQETHTTLGIAYNP